MVCKNFDLNDTNINVVELRYLIDRVAQALSVDREILLHTGDHELDQLSQLLNMWLTMKDERNRAKVLAFVQSAAAQEIMRDVAK